MFSDQTLSYLNKYHTGETGETPSEYSEKIKDFNEHMDSVTYTQIVGQDTPNNVSDDIYVGKVEKRNKSNLNKDHLRVNVDEMNNMIGDSVLSNPEKMLQNRFNKFSRYGYIDPTHEFVTGAREYLFFSKPDLNLVYNNNAVNPQLSDVPFFNDAFNKYKLSYYALQQTYSSSSVIGNGTSIDLNNKYINILSNMVTSSLDLSDISASDVTGNQNLYQVNTSYREGSLALGSSKWHMIRTVVLPNAIDGIVTGGILAIGRIVGESAALLFTAGFGLVLNINTCVKLFL